MPKVRQAIVLVTIHEDATPRASHSKPAYSWKQKGMVGLYLVDVYPNDVSPSDKLIDTTAHEFGHVLQNLFDTPTALADPRRGIDKFQRLLLDNNMVPPEVLQRQVDAEAEAWDFAQKMWPDLDPATRKANLDTYKQGLEMWHKAASAT